VSGLPANISISSARLPQTYEAAKSALANCARIDECQDWADKAQALASYAKQADDDALRKLADRIQARAVRRCGELLKQYDGRGRPAENNMGVHTISRADAAKDAGLSKHKVDTAVRVSNIPSADFDTAVESDRPPTVTKLAEMGKHSRPVAPAAPSGFREATAALGTVDRFASFCRSHDPEFVAGGVMPSEVCAVREQVAEIDAWMDRFVVNLKE
jgi:hypothetical protein